MGLIPSVPTMENRLLDGQISELLVLRSRCGYYYIGRLCYHQESQTWYAIHEDDYSKEKYKRFSDAYTALLRMK